MRFINQIFPFIRDDCVSEHSCAPRCAQEASDDGWDTRMAKWACLVHVRANFTNSNDKTCLRGIVYVIKQLRTQKRFQTLTNSPQNTVYLVKMATTWSN